MFWKAIETYRTINDPVKVISLSFYKMYIYIFKILLEHCAIESPLLSTSFGGHTHFVARK